MSILEVADNIFQIDIGSGIGFSLSYLVVGKQSALIEPGATIQVDQVLQEIEAELKIKLESISYIIPTHVHVDHAGGAGYMSQKLGLAKLAGHPICARHMIDPSRIIQASQAAFGPDFEKSFGHIYPVPEAETHVLKDKEIIDLGDRTLTALYTTGHATHHLCLYDEPSQGIFSGDALGAYFADVDVIMPINPVGFDMDQALSTINELQGLNSQIIFYSHYSIGDKPDELMTRTSDELKNYHTIVLEALRSGQNSEDILQLLENHLTNQGMPEAERNYHSLSMTIDGYTAYFKRSGLI